MKKIILLFTLGSIVLFMISCNENRVFKDRTENFENFRWDNNSFFEFKPEILDAEIPYQIYITFRHVKGFQFPSLNVNVDRTSPSGAVESKNYKLQVMGSDGYLSDCAGSYCDLKVLVEDDFRFPQEGIYTYTIQHLGETNPLLNVMHVGLIIEKK